MSCGHSEYGQHGGTENYNDWDINKKLKDQFHAVPRILVVILKFS